MGIPRFTPIAVTTFLSAIILLSGCQKASRSMTDSASASNPTGVQDWTKDHDDVKATVENFLVVAGNYDIDGMRALIADKANLGIGWIRDGEWQTTTMTIDEYFESVRNRELTPYFEPVKEYTILVNEGQLALVWADAVLHRFGIPRSRNIDNFTLIKRGDEWKFLNLSFTAQALPQEEMKYDMEKFARGYAQAWSGKRPDFVSQFYDENGTLRVNDGEPAVGRNAITEVARSFMTDLPDMVVSYDSLVTGKDGPEFHWTLTATNSGPGGTGNIVRVSGYEIWQMNDEGFVLNSQGVFPSEEYARQLKFGIE